MKDRTFGVLSTLSWAALAALKMGDVVSTYVGIHAGIATEASPLPRALFSFAGLGAGLALDFVLAMAFALAVYGLLRLLAKQGAIGDEWRWLWLMFMGFFCAVAALAVVNNLIAIGA